MRWKHWKDPSSSYEIVCFAVQESTLTPVVVYRKCLDGTTWTRPCSEFFDGRFRQVVLDEEEADTE